MSCPSNPLQLSFNDLSIIDAKPIYFNYPSVRIYVIGCGGTGSFLVTHLCRIANFLAVDIFRGSMKSTWIAQENIDRIVERMKVAMGTE